MPANAYNIFKGEIKYVESNAEGTEVTIEIAPGIEITSSISDGSARQLRQAVGKNASAVIESVDVILAVD